MNPTIKTVKDCVIITERNPVTGMYTVAMMGPTHRDKVRCDTYQQSREYARAFAKIAKAKS